MNLNIGKLLKSQNDFIRCDKPLASYIAGLGGGKSRTLTLWAIMRALKGRKIMLTEPTYGMIRDILIPTIDEILGLLGIASSCKFNRSNRPELFLPNGGKIDLRSCENPNLLRGGNYHDFGMDEVSYNKNDEAYKILIGRTRLSEDAQHRLVGTPKGKDWVYKLNVRKQSPIFRQSTITNGFLPKSYRRNLIEEYGGLDSDFAKQELLGEIVNFEGGIYPTSKIIFKDFVSPINMAQAFDLAFTDKKNSDYNAYGLAGFDKDSLFNICHAERWKFKAPETKQIMKERILDVDLPTLIETNSGGQVIFDDLVSDQQLNGATLIPVYSSVNKIARGMGLASAMSMGKVIMKKADWNEMLIDEFDSISLDDSHTNDDMVDTDVTLYNHLKYGNSYGMNIKSIM